MVNVTIEELEAFQVLLRFPVIYDFAVGAGTDDGSAVVATAAGLTLADNDRVAAAYFQAVHRHVWASDFLPPNPSNSPSKAPRIAQLEACIALALRIFTAENITGELSDTDVAVLRPVLLRFSAPVEAPAALDRFCRRLLTTDGEMPSECVRLAPLLLLCKVLVTLPDEAPTSTAAAATADGLQKSSARFLLPRTSIWPLRVLFRQQLCLEHRAHTLFLALADCIDALLAPATGGGAEGGASAAVLVEVGHVQNYFHRPEKAAESFVAAAKQSGLVLQESVMLGRRTRWQQTKMLQQVLNAKSASAPEPLSADELRGQPRVIGGEKSGHDFLDRPKASTFDSAGQEHHAANPPPDAAAAAAADAEADATSAAASDMQPLSHLDKAIILAQCINIRNTNPHHGLTTHHMQTYVERVVADLATAPFAIRSMSLLLRSRIEHNRSRAQERSFLQRQELLDQYVKDHHARDPSSFFSASKVTAEGDSTTAAAAQIATSTWHRTDPKYFYLVAFPTIWALKREFADTCFEENLNKTALDLYEQIADWEKIIMCCRQLDKRKRAESLALEKLEEDPHNPMLWVALGEATREDAHLWKAWELCRHKMAAPMRALAKLALEREHFDKVLEYFDRAVAINPVFGGDWFSLGYASLRLQRLDRCCEAFTRVCQLDPNDAYAWNNLGSVLLKQGKIRPAFSATSQALHNNRRNWRMWQNYFAIGVEIEEVTEATLALSTLLEIAQRNVMLEGAAMVKFTQNAIRYMKGEIRATDNVVEGDLLEAAAAAGGGAGKVRLSQDDGSSATADDDDVEFTGLVPLCSDLPGEDASGMGGSTQTTEALALKEEKLAASRRQMIGRYQTRLRGVFQTMYNLFVDDADLYLCGAMFFGYVDGRDAALTYHQKELRCAKQKDQWERRPELFERVCQSLLAAVALALTAPQPVEGQEGATEGDATSQQLQRDLKVEVDAALQLAADHLSEASGYRKLQIASKQLGKALAAAKK